MGVMVTSLPVVSALGGGPFSAFLSGFCLLSGLVSTTLVDAVSSSIPKPAPKPSARSVTTTSPISTPPPFSPLVSALATFRS